MRARRNCHPPKKPFLVGIVTNCPDLPPFPQSGVSSETTEITQIALQPLSAPDYTGIASSVHSKRGRGVDNGGRGGEPHFKVCKSSKYPYIAVI